MHQVLRSSDQERQGTSRESPTESHKDGEWPGASPLPGKAERCESVQHREEKAEGALISTYRYLQGGSQADVTRFFFQQCPAIEQGAIDKLEHRKLHLNMRKNAFTSRVTEH